MSDALHVDRLLAAGGCPWLGRRWSRAVGVAAVAAWEASGLSQSAWCREQGVAVYRFGYWWRRLAGGREVGGDSLFVPVRVSEGVGGDIVGGGGVSLMVGGVVVQVARGFDGALLRQVVEVLR